MTRNWSHEDLRQLRTFAHTHTAAEVSAITGRSAASIYNMATRTGVTLKRAWGESSRHYQPAPSATILRNRMIDAYAKAKTADEQVRIREQYRNDLRHIERKQRIKAEEK